MRQEPLQILPQIGSAVRPSNRSIEPRTTVRVLFSPVIESLQPSHAWISFEMALRSCGPAYQARDLTETASHRPFPSLHASKASVFAALMVIATEVKDPMDQQCDDFFVQRPLAFLRLAHGGRQRNHDITQWPGG